MTREIPLYLLVTTAVLASSSCSATGSAVPEEHAPPADVVISWNDLIFRIAEAEDAFLTLKGVRTAAMAHLAMHDALTAIDPRFRPFRATDPAPDVGPVQAANEAAYAVAISQYPDRADVLDAERARWAGDDDARATAARDLGRRTATAVLATRERDGWNADPEYAFHPMGPGVYAEFNEHSATPEGFVFGAGWALARPFVMDGPDQLRVGPPPDIDSDTYTRAFDEVKEVGRRDSPTRTGDQTHLAMWWKEFVESSHNRLGRELVAEEGLDVWEAARFFALLDVSIFDGYVASFDSKFHYNHWRPYTAIRWASNDGNPDTEEEEDWTNLHDHTYAFPSYPSAHGTVCAAAMTVFEDVFGPDRSFVMTIPEVDSQGPMSPKIPTDPPSRSFSSFGEAAVECSMSRVYLGIHFRYDSEVGTELGRHVGEHAVASLLQPVDPRLP